MSDLRVVVALVVCIVVGAAVVATVAALARVVQPGSTVTRTNRLPPTFKRMLGWARSRSLRLWCPDVSTEAVLVAHLRTEPGRRLRRLGVSIVTEPGSADVIVVEEAMRSELASLRAKVPAPCASIVLTQRADLDEFVRAVVELSVALRWPGSEDAR